MYHKKRILITMSFSFSIRYIVRTGLLDELAKFATPVVILTWEENALIDELQNRKYEVHVMPEQKRGAAYRSVVQKLDFYHYCFTLKSRSKQIEENYLAHFKTIKNRAYSFLKNIKLKSKFLQKKYRDELVMQEQDLLRTDTNFDEILQWIKSLNAAAVFTLTPFHAQEDLLLRAAKEAGCKMITSILSFDNLTKRNRIPVEYDVYMVWNKYNFAELQTAYPFTKNKKVFITGAPQFDFYFSDKWFFSKEEWLDKTGIKKSKNQKIILYSGGPPLLFPDEPHYLKDMADALQKKKIEGDPLILFRCHPADKAARWKNYVGACSNIIFDSAWHGEKKLLDANVTDDDIKKLCSTLAYTDVHINLCSTMTLDGSVFHKPQIGPAYDEQSKSKQKDLRAMYLQEHFKPIMKSGVLFLAKSKHQLIDAINRALNGDFEQTNFSKEVLQSVITFTDGQSKDRVVQNIRDALSN